MTVILGKSRIAPPPADKSPLKANAFQAMGRANTQLWPLFPYVGDGDLVPCATLLWGGPKQQMGAFNHSNSVDEVAVCFASVNARSRAGFVYVGARNHLVGKFFEDAADTRNLHAAIVTQRQAERDEPQTETLLFFCARCQTPLVEHTFSAKNAAADEPGHVPAFETVTAGAKCLETFNASEAARTCPHCATVNDAFPIEPWGWQVYHERTGAAERARRQFTERSAPAA